MRSALTFLADPYAVMTKRLGLHEDLGNLGLGVRCRRFAMITTHEAKVWWMGFDEEAVFDRVLGKLAEFPPAIQKLQLANEILPPPFVFLDATPNANQDIGNVVVTSDGLELRVKCVGDRPEFGLCRLLADGRLYVSALFCVRLFHSNDLRKVYPFLRDTTNESNRTILLQMVFQPDGMKKPYWEENPRSADCSTRPLILSIYFEENLDESQALKSIDLLETLKVNFCSSTHFPPSGAATTTGPLVYEAPGAVLPRAVASLFKDFAAGRFNLPSKMGHSPEEHKEMRMDFYWSERADGRGLVDTRVDQFVSRLDAPRAFQVSSSVLDHYHFLLRALSCMGHAKQAVTGKATIAVRTQW
eukprot:Polyplicarium_translucidae@DN550_c0_g1_i1.p1